MENFAYGEIIEQSLISPHPWEEWYSHNKTKYN